MEPQSVKNITAYLSALGIINALGCGKKDVLSALLKGDTSGILPNDELVANRTVMVGAVQDELPEIPSSLPCCYNTRSNRLLLSAYLQIEDSVKAAITRYGNDRIAVVLGISTSGIAEGERAMEHNMQSGSFPDGYSYEMQEMGTPPHFLSEYLGLTCWSYTISTACSSSAKAFASARNLLAMDLCDAVIVGGGDSLCRLTLNGFSSLEAVSSGRTNPFSKNRDGITIGEGAALFLMEREPAEIKICGIGETSDASHITAPHPEGAGAIAAIQAALADAKLGPEDIGYVNLHGTGTAANDSVESRVVGSVFPAAIPCSSTKPLTGHTLGAAGATEAAFCWLALSGLNKDRQLPPHIWDGEKDPEIHEINLISKDSPQKLGQSEYALSNSFAFGGNNACLILGRSSE